MKTNLLKRAFAAGVMYMAFITTMSAFTAVTSGDWSNAATWGGVAPGASVSNQDISIPNGITVNLDMDVTFSGLLNSFAVNGTLNSSASHSLSIGQGTFSGSGAVSIGMLEFTNLLATMSYTGTLSVDHFKNSGAALNIGGAVSIADTLNLDAGSIVLNTGANMQMAGATLAIVPVVAVFLVLQRYFVRGIAMTGVKG